MQCHNYNKKSFYFWYLKGYLNLFLNMTCMYSALWARMSSVIPWDWIRELKMKVTPPANQRLSWKVSGNHDCICIHSVPFENFHSCAMHNPILRNTTKYLIKMSFHISNYLQGPRIWHKGKKCMQYMHIICISSLILSPSQTDTHTINMQMHEQTGACVIYIHTHTDDQIRRVFHIPRCCYYVWYVWWWMRPIWCVQGIFDSLLLFICVCNAVCPCSRRETELISSLWVWCQRAQMNYAALTLHVISSTPGNIVTIW